MSSVARGAFEENKADVDQLLKIHGAVGGSGPGRKYGLEVLNKSAIVLITAAWEAYVEDVAKAAFEVMLSEGIPADNWPNKVKALASKTLKESKNELDVWKLADKGWRTVLQVHRNEIFEKWVGGLDSPKSAKVFQLFETLIGLKTLPNSWAWQNMTPASAAAKLDEYITIRGAIAHRAKHDKKIAKNWVRDYLAHVENLVYCTDTCIADYIRKIIGTSPW